MYSLSTASDAVMAAGESLLVCPIGHVRFVLCAQIMQGALWKYPRKKYHGMYVGSDAYLPTCLPTCLHIYPKQHMRRT